MRNDWNTQFPELSEIKAAVDRLAEDPTHRLDVHTVTVTLSNGGWALEVLATDDDMQDVTLTGEVDRYGEILDLTEAGA